MRLLLLIALLLFASCTRHEPFPAVGQSDGGIDTLVPIDPTLEPFWMGSSTPLAFDDEQPVHLVQLTQKFWMDSTEITQALYKEIMESAGFPVPQWDGINGRGDAYPAYDVSWGDAVRFCNARSVIKGLDTVYTYSGVNVIGKAQVELIDVVADISKNGYRLPTEAEWEFAARGATDTTQDFYWGNDTTEVRVDLFAWYKNNSQTVVGSSSGLKRGVKPTATRVANAYGLFDMAGNVSEWCHDYFARDYYTNSPVENPINSTTSTYGHTIRGGSWVVAPQGLRSAVRDGHTTFNYTLGFRTVRNGTF